MPRTNPKPPAHRRPTDPAPSAQRPTDAAPGERAPGERASGERASGERRPTDPLWKGRNAEPPDPAFFAFQRSLPYDVRLLQEDLAVNAAWARALGRAGLLEASDVAAIEKALGEIARDLSPSVAAKGDAEDVHTLVEAELTRRVGDAGRRIHRGKSRNDQVATDLRLWVARSCAELSADVRMLARALADQAEQLLARGTVMAGYTHLQQAEPVLAAHWALAHAEPLLRDLRRLAQVREAALASCPLGSAALSGTPLPVDRAALASDLGFAAPSPNSIDAVSDRDFALGFLHAATVCALHVSRLAEDLVLFSSREFGLVRLPDAFTTGSSALPQKRNPDACELARAKAGRVLGRYAGLAAALRALPTGYNKDLQEDKEAVFDAFDSVSGVARALAGTVRGMRFDDERARRGLGEWILAAELAERLTATGMPFRDAYGAVARAVQALDAGGAGRAVGAGPGRAVGAGPGGAVGAGPGAGPGRLEDLDARAWASIDPAFTADVVAGLSLDAAIARRAAVGGTAPDRVAEAHKAIVRTLDAADAGAGAGGP